MAGNGGWCEGKGEKRRRLLVEVEDFVLWMDLRELGVVDAFFDRCFDVEGRSSSHRAVGKRTRPDTRSAAATKGQSWSLSLPRYAISWTHYSKFNSF